MSETAAELIERLELLLEDIAEYGLHCKPGEDMETAEKRLKARARNTLAFHRRGVGRETMSDAHGTAEAYPDEWLLPRRYDLEPRRWQLPSGEIVGEAINREAIELLKSDPDEYFRRSRRYVAHRERDE